MPLFKKMQGMVFFAVLIFLLIFSLLSLSNLMHLRSIIKSSLYSFEQQKMSNIAAYLLRQIEERSEVRCFIAPTAAFKGTNGCHGDFSGVHYEYAIEDLKVNKCGYYEIDINHQMLAPKIIRVTLLIRPKMRSVLKWQTTVAIKSQAKTVCALSPYRVKLGRQMWRVG